jgi:hypothetical protein
MSHNLLIFLHAAAAVISFGLGITLLLPLTKWRSNLSFLSKLFIGSLALMLLFLVTVVITDWTSLDTMERVIFSGLNLLGLFMVWRAFQAYQLLETTPRSWQSKYTEHIGFDLISLFEGFVIVGALDLGAPGWLVGLLAALGFVIGRWLVHLAESRFANFPL